MTGILAYGSYLPHHRLRHDRTPVGGSGSRCVASYDEDSTTLAVEAARRALGAGPQPATVVLATSTPAYADKTNASAVHAALGLPSSVLALDVAGLRSGAAALSAALRAGGSPTLVVAADVRSGRPGSDEELGGGDAGAALLVGDGPHVLARHLGGASATRELLDRWRLPGEQTARVWEERFAETVYAELADEALTAALKDASLTLDDVDVVAVAGTHARAVRGVQRQVGRPAAPDVMGTTGRPGTAHAGLLVSSWLDTAQPGQRLALLSLADGADVLLLEATEELVSRRSRPSVQDQLDAGVDDLDYLQFLTWRGFLDKQPPRRPDPARPAAPPAYRGREWKFGLTGSQDRSSGLVHLPPQRIAYAGRAADDMVPLRVAETGGTLATYTVDHLAFSPSPPVIVAVVDVDGGGRFVGELTDARPEEVAVGLRVEMTFRRLYTAQGVHNYFWKARPVRAGRED